MGDSAQIGVGCDLVKGFIIWVCLTSVLAICGSVTEAEQPTFAMTEFISDDDRILFLLEDIARGLRRDFDARVNNLGLNQTQWRMVGQLLREPSLTQAEIAKRLELESATIGQAVSSLIDAGLMERHRADFDRRAWQLRMTPKLQKLLPELRQFANDLHEDLWRGVSDAEKKTLFETLTRLSSNLDSD